MPDPLSRLSRLEGSPATSSNRFGTSGETTMKQMILTGLATEQRFGNPDPQFFLVFNDGELRVPVAPDTAEAVVQAMYGSEGVQAPAQTDNDEDAFHKDPEDGPSSEADIPQA